MAVALMDLVKYRLMYLTKVSWLYYYYYYVLVPVAIVHNCPKIFNSPPLSI